MTPAPQRIRLLEAALAQFAERGFAETTLASVASASGIPLHEIVAFYPSKYAFAMDLYHILIADLEEGAAQLAPGPLADRFAAILNRKLDLLDRHRSAFRALIAAAVDSEGPIGVLSNSTSVIRSRMSSVIWTAVAGATDCPPEATVGRLLYGVHLGIVLLWTQDTDGAMARTAVRTLHGVLSSFAPFLATPMGVTQLERLTAPLGERLNTAVNADVDGRARWVLHRLMSQRRLHPGLSSASITEDQLAPHLEIVRSALASDQPLELVLPAFPAKSPNPEKVLGKLPDMAELVALRSLQRLCDDLTALHPPGVRLHLCSDGLVFADVVGVADADVTAYGEALDAILSDLPSLTRVDLSHLFGEATPAQARARLLAGWSETAEELHQKIESTPALAHQLDGLHRFLFEDAVGVGSEQSRTQLRKHARELAFETLRRSRAWGRLLATCFPHAVRLTIHPQPLVSEKIGIHFVPTADAWLTPWHGAALVEKDGFQLVKVKLALENGATIVHRDGRASHLEMDKSLD